jgi:hypothetical protein
LCSGMGGDGARVLPHPAARVCEPEPPSRHTPLPVTFGKGTAAQRPAVVYLEAAAHTTAVLKWLMRCVRACSCDPAPAQLVCMCDAPQACYRSKHVSENRISRCNVSGNSPCLRAAAAHLQCVCSSASCSSCRRAWQRRMQRIREPYKPHETVTSLPRPCICSCGSRTSCWRVWRRHTMRACATAT